MTAEIEFLLRLCAFLECDLILCIWLQSLGFSHFGMPSPKHCKQHCRVWVFKRFPLWDSRAETKDTRQRQELRKPLYYYDHIFGWHIWKTILYRPRNILPYVLLIVSGFTDTFSFEFLIITASPPPYIISRRGDHGPLYPHPRSPPSRRRRPSSAEPSRGSCLKTRPTPQNLTGPQRRSRESPDRHSSRSGLSQMWRRGFQFFWHCHPILALVRARNE